MIAAMRVSELAGRLKLAYEGPDVDVTSAEPLEEAGPSALAFVGNRKAALKAAESAAGCLVVDADFPSGRTLIRAAEPRGAFADAILLLHPQPAPEPGIHPTAVVDPTAVIGPGTSIGPGCSVGAGSRIGSDCTLHPRVTLYPGVIVGDRAILHAGCVLGADGFGFVFSDGRYRKFPQIGRVELGDDVEIGANSCVDRAALGVTRIGNGTKLDNLVHIAHNCQIGQHVVIAAQTGLAGNVVVEDYVTIGGQVGIGDKARIETRAVLGSGCGILTSKVVRKGQVVWGTPARPLREYLEQLASLSRIPKLREELHKLLDLKGSP